MCFIPIWQYSRFEKPHDGFTLFGTIVIYDLNRFYKLIFIVATAFCKYMNHSSHYFTIIKISIIVLSHIVLLKFFIFSVATDLAYHDFSGNQ